MSQEPPRPVIDYVRRPRRQLIGLYSGLYISLAAVNIIISGFCLFFDGFVSANMLMGIRDSRRNGFLMLGACGVAIDVALIVASVASCWRALWSRRILEWALRAQVAVAIVDAVTGLLDARSYMNPIFSGEFVTFAVRGAYPILLFIAYTNIRADFYFGDHPPAETLELTGEANRPVPRFSVSGVDRSRGNFVSFHSNAPTVELARKSAILQGLGAGFYRD